MTALDVITLAEAKEHLKVDFTSEDALITRLIKSAVALIEEKTEYILYQRNEFDFVSTSDKIYKYPFALATSEDATEYQIIESRLYSSIKIIGGSTALTSNGRSVELTIGYNDASLVPSPLKDACLRLITYWYDQREMDQAKLPTDVYVMIQPYIRDFTI